MHLVDQTLDILNSYLELLAPTLKIHIGYQVLIEDWLSILVLCVATTAC